MATHHDILNITMFLAVVLWLVVAATHNETNIDIIPPHFNPNRSIPLKGTSILNKVLSNCGKVCEREYFRDLVETPSYCLTFMNGDCDQCRCDRDCFSYGDCCPDIFLFSNISRVETFGTRCTKFKQTLETSTSINIITTCRKLNSSDKNGTTCSIKNPYSVWDITPVVNYRSGETYLNKECADCNGVENGVLFEASIECYSSIDTSTFSNREELIRAILTKSHKVSESCELIMKTPQLQDGAQYRICNDEAISICNETLTNTDKFQKEVCQILPCDNPSVIGGSGLVATSFSIFLDFSRAEQFNANMETTNMDCLKKQILYPKKVECPIATSLSILLDFSRPEQLMTEETTSMDCLEKQIFNPQTVKCHDIVCARGKMFNGGSCNSVFPVVNGLFYRLHISLKPNISKDLNLSGEDIKTIGNHLMWNIHHEIWLNSYDYMVYGYDVEKASLTAPIVVRIYSEAGDTVTTHKTYTISRIVINARIITTNPYYVDQFEMSLLDLCRRQWFPNGIVLLPSYDIIDDFEWGDYLQKPSSQFFEINEIVEGSALFTELVYNSQTTRNAFANGVKLRNTSLQLISETLFCPMIALDQSDFVLFENHTVQIQSTGSILSYDYYQLLDNGTILVCMEYAIVFATHARTDKTVEYLQTFQGTQGILSLVMTCLSVFCLILTTVAFCVLPSMRTLPGTMNMFLAITLIFAQMVFQFGIGQIDNANACVAIGIVMHFLLLSSFCWMNICSMHMAKTFLFSRSSKPNSHYKCRLTIYAIYTILAPAIIVSATVLSKLLTTNQHDIGYGGRICFLSSGFLVGVSFALPLGIIIVLNAISFAITIRSIRNVQRVAPMARDYLCTYIKLSTLTGITWLLGFLAELVNFEPLWYGFIVCNAGQGILIFFSFVVTKKTLVLCKKRFASGKKSMLSDSSKTKTMISNIDSLR